MEFIPYQRQENSPFLQLLYLAFGAIGGLLLFMVLGLGVIMVVYGWDFLKDMSWLTAGSAAGTGALKIMLTAQQLGLFLFPALLLGITEGKRPASFYGLKTPHWPVLGLVLLLMIASMPMMGGINELNQRMVLPDFLKAVEDWMRRMEDENAKTTEALLQMRTVVDYLSTLLVVAIVPAICEEFLFRGALQRTLLRWIKNPHVGIWLSAVIFSAIHFQFFGFFPRLLLGAGFGYICYWTGSLWYAVFAHFLNNGFAVTVAWYFQLKGGSVNDDLPVQWFAAVVSMAVTFLLLRTLKLYR